MPFRSITGHQRMFALLSRAIARDTLPPSVLFAGPPGIGKRRTALAVAEVLNCLAPRHGPAEAGHYDCLNPRPAGALEIDACGECASCRRIGRGVHPDVIIL